MNNIQSIQIILEDGSMIAATVDKTVIIDPENIGKLRQAVENSDALIEKAKKVIEESGSG